VVDIVETERGDAVRIALEQRGELAHRGLRAAPRQQRRDQRQVGVAAAVEDAPGPRPRGLAGVEPVLDSQEPRGLAAQEQLVAERLTQIERERLGELADAAEGLAVGERGGDERRLQQRPHGLLVVGQLIVRDAPRVPTHVFTRSTASESPARRKVPPLAATTVSPSAGATDSRTPLETAETVCRSGPRRSATALSSRRSSRLS